LFAYVAGLPERLGRSVIIVDEIMSLDGWAARPDGRID
jgi:hypothetical protein